MKITYDAEVDAAYVYLTAIAPGGVAKTVPCDAGAVGGTINLDFDKEGRLVGIEVLDASEKLPADVLRRAD